MKYEIIASGSDGNAVVFNDFLMVDCGVSFSKLTPYYKKLRLVLLTHIHGDHFNKTTIRKLAQERPALRWGTPPHLVAEVMACGVKKKNIDILYSNQGEYLYVGVDVTPIVLKHNVDNYGYKLLFDNNESVVYATDTCFLPELPNCDYYFIEANYKNLDELAERVNAKLENGEFVYETGLSERHLSEEYANDWLARNRKESIKHLFLHEHQEKEKV